MQYFCAQCQSKHSVTDIKFDMYEICHQSVADQLMVIRSEFKDDQILEVFSDIIKFVNSQQNAGDIFLFGRDDILYFLTDAQVTPTSIIGTFTLTFKWVLDVYSRHLVNPEDSKKRERLTKLEAKGNYIVFSQDMDFRFDIVPGTNDVVADYIAPGRVGHNNRFAKISTKRSCPYCGKNLSSVVGKAEEIVIAVTGVERAGKTSCITAITSSLLNNDALYNSLGLKMHIPSNDPQWTELQKEIKSYNEGYVVTKTPIGQTQVPAYSYMINVQKNPNHNRVLTFVDMPGEFWNGESGLTNEFFEHYAGLFYNIDCIWLFIPRLAVQKVKLGSDEAKDFSEMNEIERRNLANQRRIREASADSTVTIEGSSAAKISSTLSSLADYLNRPQLDPNGRQLPAKGIPPVAVILTKTEIIENPNNPNEANMVGKYNLFPVRNAKLLTGAEVRSINKEEIGQLLGRDKERQCFYISEWHFYESARKVRNYIAFQNRPLLEAIEENCPNHFFIAMAAYGHPAAPKPGYQDANTQENSRVPYRDFSSDGYARILPVAPTPYHEMYPLIWTLGISTNFPIQHGFKWHSYSFWSRLLGTGKSTEIEGTDYINFDYKHYSETNLKAVKEGDEDAATEKDIAANLLFNPQNEKYTYTSFNHPRR